MKNSLKSGLMIYAVDFDGTLSLAGWPNVGSPNKPLFDFLIRQKRDGDKIILWTCRVGDRLEEAVNFCKDNGLEFDEVNRNLPSVIEAFGGDTRKIVANVYIDDSAMSADQFVKMHCKKRSVRDIRVRS
jgi:hypothetical protein